jgi:hypothetical protein
MRVHLLNVAACVIAISAVAACGGSSSSSTSSSTSSPSPSPSAATIASVDACKLVTADDATTAVGTTVTNLSAAGGASIPGACYYGTQDASSVVFVYAQAYPDASAADQVSPDQMARILNGQFGVANAKSVSGIGDKAFEYTVTAAQTGSNGEAIFVFKSNVILFIVLTPSTDSSKIETLAKAAVSRL